jgi:branched-subunit amino acid transport protein AzlD
MIPLYDLGPLSGPKNRQWPQNVICHDFVRFVDIGRIVDHHCFNFLFTSKSITYLRDMDIHVYITSFVLFNIQVYTGRLAAPKIASGPKIIASKLKFPIWKKNTVLSIFPENVRQQCRFYTTP